MNINVSENNGVSHGKLARILVVDDDEAIGKAMHIGLTKTGYIVKWVGNSKQGMELISTWRPDVVILDYEMPEINGLTFCQQVRLWSQTPIIVLSVRSSDEDKIELLSNGADDYLVKPFNMNELIARIQVELRHTAHSAVAQSCDAIFTFGDISINFEQRQVLQKNVEVHLTPNEYEVLKYLATNAGRVVTHQNILRAVWGPQFEDENHYLRVCIAQMRRKLEPEAERPRYIVTEPGIGYRLKINY